MPTHSPKYHKSHSLQNNQHHHTNQAELSQTPLPAAASSDSESASSSSYSALISHHQNNTTQNTLTNSARYSSLKLVQSDSNDVKMSYDSGHEMDEDYYDLCSDAVCDFFSKLDTNHRKQVSDEAIKIGFAFLEIKLTDIEFHMFINEITNYKSKKSVRLDMLRSFVLNIQNKSFSPKLKHIRKAITDALLHKPTAAPYRTKRRTRPTNANANTNGANATNATNATTNGHNYTSNRQSRRTNHTRRGNDTQRQRLLSRERRSNTESSTRPKLSRIPSPQRSPTMPNLDATYASNTPPSFNNARNIHYGQRRTQPLQEEEEHEEHDHHMQHLTRSQTSTHVPNGSSLSTLVTAASPVDAPEGNQMMKRHPFSPPPSAPQVKKKRADRAERPQLDDLPTLPNLPAPNASKSVQPLKSPRRVDVSGGSGASGTAVVNGRAGSGAEGRGAYGALPKGKSKRNKMIKASTANVYPSANPYGSAKKVEFDLPMLQWRPHVTDFDENGTCQFDLLICTLKYSLISTALELYGNGSLDVNQDKFFMIMSRKNGDRSVFQYVFEQYFEFMALHADRMTLKAFESGLRRCGITFDRKDIAMISCSQLAQHTSRTPGKVPRHDQPVITKGSLVRWVLEAIYRPSNTHYLNYTKHYHQYFKWIERDLFSLVDRKSYKRARKMQRNKQVEGESVNGIANGVTNGQVKVGRNRRMKHKSTNYPNPVVLPAHTTAKQQRKKRHKSTHHLNRARTKHDHF